MHDTLNSHFYEIMTFYNHPSYDKNIKYIFQTYFMSYLYPFDEILITREASFDDSDYKDQKVHKVQKI